MAGGVATADEKPIRDLIATLADADDDRSFQAQVGLMAYGRQAVEYLLPQVGHPSERARYRVAMILGRSRDPRALTPLLALTDDPSPAVRYDAVVALGWLGDAGAVPRLLELQAGGMREDGVDNAAYASLIRLGVLDEPEDE